MGQLPNGAWGEVSLVGVPPTQRTLQQLWGLFEQKCKTRQGPGSGQQPCLAGVPSGTLGRRPDARATPPPMLRVCTRWLGELMRWCRINVAALFYKVS